MYYLFELFVTGSYEGEDGSFESTYELMLESNKVIKDIDEEIYATHKFICEIYNKKFPELEALVPQKIDYVKTVKIIGNEMDLTLVDLSSVLSPSMVMIVSGKPAGEPYSIAR